MHVPRGHPPDSNALPLTERRRQAGQHSARGGTHHDKPLARCRRDHDVKAKQREPQAAPQVACNSLQRALVQRWRRRRRRVGRRCRSSLVVLCWLRGTLSGRTRVAGASFGARARRKVLWQLRGQGLEAVKAKEQRLLCGRVACRRGRRRGSAGRRDVGY